MSFASTGSADAIPRARQAIRELEPGLAPTVQANLTLLVSELVTNSVRHAEVTSSAGVELRMSVGSDRVRVEVRDQGGGFEPDRRQPDENSRSGWGLYLVDQLADRWGVDDREGTTAWFELDRS